uniref:Uncharacterized protein n=1 Tax=Clastoptera arizonana TaxID=38151 RepID=A0A1B6DM27_9HEMI
MYKTVRQGDNSLQYTILAQDDYTPTGSTMKRRRSSRRNTAFILIVTLILGCGIVAAAVLIPVLLSSNVVALPARFQTFAVAATNIKGKYNIQGTQYIALLPLKDATGHFNAFQLRPTATTTAAPINASRKPTTEFVDLGASTNQGSQDARSSKVDQDRPRNLSQALTWSEFRLLPTDSAWLDTHIYVIIGAGTSILTVVVLVYLLVRHRRSIALRPHVPLSETSGYTDSDKGTLLAEISGEED